MTVIPPLMLPVTVVHQTRRFPNAEADALPFEVTQLIMGYLQWDVGSALLTCKTFHHAVMSQPVIRIAAIVHRLTQETHFSSSSTLDMTGTFTCNLKRIILTKEDYVRFTKIDPNCFGLERLIRMKSYLFHPDFEQLMEQFLANLAWHPLNVLDSKNAMICTLAQSYLQAFTILRGHYQKREEIDSIMWGKLNTNVKFGKESLVKVIADAKRDLLFRSSEPYLLSILNRHFPSIPASMLEFLRTNEEMEIEALQQQRHINQEDDDRGESGWAEADRRLLFPWRFGPVRALVLDLEIDSDAENMNSDSEP